MFEIFGGEGIENAFKDLNVTARNTYKGKRFEVWEISYEDFCTLDNVPDEEWKYSWGWWRYSAGCTVDWYPKTFYKVNGNEMIGYINIQNSNDDEDAEDRDDLEMKEYPTFTDYLACEFGATTETNVCAFCASLAALHHMTMGAFMTKYQGETELKDGKTKNE